MNEIDKIRTYYEPKMIAGQPDYKMLGWESREAQQARFEVLKQNVELCGRKILDVGCGLGNLLEYLECTDTCPEYTGVDILPGMIEKAKAKKLSGTFYCMDIFKEDAFEDRAFNVVYASGIFNLNLGNNREFLLKAVNEFFRLADEAVAFNLLHFKSPDRDDRYSYFDPGEVEHMLETLPFAIREIRIIEHYLENDFTVVCRL